MKTDSGYTNDTLENIIFRRSIYLVLTFTLLLIIYDVFFTEDYHSVITEVFAIAFFGVYL